MVTGTVLRVFYTTLRNVPQELRVIDSPFWRSSKFLKKTFKATHVNPLIKRSCKK
jgi:hypothetical protein